MSHDSHALVIYCHEGPFNLARQPFHSIILLSSIVDTGHEMLVGKIYQLDNMGMPVSSHNHNVFYLVVALENMGA